MKHKEEHYQGMDLTVPAFVMRDKNLKGMQKLIYALYYKMSKTEPILTFYPKKSAQIFDTRVDDICYNFQQLLDKGYITNMTKHPVTPNTTNVEFKVNILVGTKVSQCTPKQLESGLF
jgi:hypothetical protein